jgi:hypothetical protein
MTEDSGDLTPLGLAQKRMGELLEILSRQGFTQQEVASRAGLPSQYVSDIKRGRRPMTELVARRLGEQFDVHYQWLMGTSSAMMPPRPQASPPASAGSAVWVPIFPHPIEDEPRANPKWNGTGVEVSGIAAAQLVLATQPYVLRFGHNDIQGRLRKGDLILISQASSDVAEISVVRHLNKLFLARRNHDGAWERVANGNTLPAASPIKGHCIGVVWSSLCRGPV